MLQDSIHDSDITSLRHVIAADVAITKTLFSQLILVHKKQQLFLLKGFITNFYRRQ